MRHRIAVAVFATLALLGFGSTAAFAHDIESEARPVLAQTGYDFTPMLITAAVFLLIAGIAVVVAKYFVARAGSH